MSFSAELKDFTSGFKSGMDMYEKAVDAKSLRDYRTGRLAHQADAGVRPGFGNDDGSGPSGGSSSGGAKLSTADQAKTARTIYSSLLDKGYTTTAAAGITGNLWHESGGFGGKAGDDGTAHGIAQWRGDRWTAMQAYAKQQGKDPNDLNTQVDYLDKELKTNYASAYNLLQHTNDVKTATGIFADQYEQPAGSGKGNYSGINGWGSRLSFANQVYGFGQIGGGAGPAISKAARDLKTGSQPAAAPGRTSSASPTLGSIAPETQIGADQLTDATGQDQEVAYAGSPGPVPDDQQQDDTQAAATGGLIRRRRVQSYADGGAVTPDFTNVSKGINTNFNPAFRKSLLNLQQAATAAGIKTKLISGVRSLDDQKQLYANKLAGDAGKPLPFPKRGAVKVAAVPGTSPHEDGRAADLLAVDPKQQGALDKLAAKDPNLMTVGGDPGHYQLNTGGKDGGSGTMVASKGSVPPPPDAPEEPEREDTMASSPAQSAGAQGGQQDEGNSKAMADATERGRADLANANYLARGQQDQLLQEGAQNSQELSQGAQYLAQGPARQPETPAETAPPPQQAQGAARGGVIRGYAPGGVVDATGYIAPNTATLASATEALAPAVAAATAATPAVSTTSTPAATTAAPAATKTAAPAATTTAATGVSPQQLSDLQAQLYQQTINSANANAAMNSSGSGRGAETGIANYPGAVDAIIGLSNYQTQANQAYAANPDFGLGMPQSSASSTAAPVIPPVTGTDRGSVWNPTTQSWQAGVGYTYDQNTKAWVPASGSQAAQLGYAEGGTVDDDDDDEAVSTTAAAAPAPAPAPAAPAPAPAQPTPTGDARTRAGAPGSTDVGDAPPTAPAQPAPPLPQPPPNLVADALHSGLMSLTKMFGLDKVGAVQDPDTKSRIDAFNNGAGAADGDAMAAVHKAVDPNNTLTQQQLASASVAALKTYYDNKGDPDAGAKAIGEIMQHQKAVSAHFSATAQQAFQQGDVVNGVKFLKAAYDQVPDGQHIDAAIQPDKTVAFRLTDSGSGRVIYQGVANSQQLARLAQVGSTGAPYVKAVAATAARAKTPTMPDGTPTSAPAAAPAPAVDTAQASPTAPAPSATNGSFFLGDSIADGLKTAANGQGDTKVGRSPAAVLQAINAATPDQLRGRNIVLSTGLSNNPTDMASVTKQIAALKAKGVDPGNIKIVGLGQRFDNLNPALQKIARDNGVSFGGGFRAGKDGVHPQDYGGALKALNLGGAGPRSDAGPAGGSGAYLVNRQADLTSGVNQGAVDTGGAKYAQADTVKTDATVDASTPKVTVPDTSAPAPAPPGKATGQLAPGNINLARRPAVKNADGSINTDGVHSFAIDVDGKQVLIPSVIDGKIVSTAEAYKHFLDTGENLGTFDSVANVAQYQRRLRATQQEYYKNGDPSEDADADEAVPTDRKPMEPVPASKIVTPKLTQVTPTPVDEEKIPEELTKPVPPERHKVAGEEAPEVTPVEPKSVDDQYDLTPRTFDKPPPNPDDYFANYNKWKNQAQTTGERKLLVQMYARANTAYREADSAWKDEKAVFETEEGKRLSAANEQAGRAQTRENTTATETFDISKDKRKEVLTANEKAQEDQNKQDDIIAAQKLGLNKDEVARIVKRNEDARADARAADKDEQARQDKIAEEQAKQERENSVKAHDEAVSRNVAATSANTTADAADLSNQRATDKEFRDLAQKEKGEATIKTPTSDEQKALDEQLAKTSGTGDAAKTPLDDLYSQFVDPETQQPYTDPAAMKKEVGAKTLNGLRELTGHIIHANGVTPETAAAIAGQLTNSDPDNPDKEYYRVGDGQGNNTTDKAGNVLVKVPGYPTVKISKEMAQTVGEIQDGVHAHLVKVAAAKKVQDALEKVRGDTRSATVGGAVDTGLTAARNILFPTKPVSGNEPVKRVDKKFGPPSGFKFERAKPGEIDPETKKLFPELQDQ